ncbi:MAG TPA: glycosyltransferase [Anaerolineales bacterium]|nr:glycosyltransferase [Anaerolineales bacterium]
MSGGNTSKPKVDLICISEIQSDAPSWGLGNCYISGSEPKAVFGNIARSIEEAETAAILFWDTRLPFPDPSLIESLLEGPADVWHAGLRLRTKGLPEEIDYVSPGWTFNRDPDPDLAAISWRISLRACLVRTTVLKTLGHIDMAFETLEGAALEMGYRWIWGGAITLHHPGLLPVIPNLGRLEPSLTDRYLFIIRHYQPIWSRYVLVRRALSNAHFIREHRAYQRARKRALGFQPLPKEWLPRPEVEKIPRLRVSVLIPTISRYPYLKTTLESLRRQTYLPMEVICVDQTPLPERQPEIYEGFPELNLKVIWRDDPGQCSARNAGLEKVQGEAVLFLDDDVEIDNNYIKALLEGLTRCRTEIVQGVWFSEISNGETAAETDRYFRLSDRFATGNGMALVTALKKVGGFDLNYNRNYRADADMGMRLYLSGALSMITPHAREISLSPPTGGLKFFGATDGSRNIKLLQPWPAVTQTYYWLRYHTRRQVREALILNIIAAAIPRKQRYSTQFSRKLMHVIGQFWTFPFRAWGIWQSVNLARRMLRNGIQIPQAWAQDNQ